MIRRTVLLLCLLGFVSFTGAGCSKDSTIQNPKVENPPANPPPIQKPNAGGGSQGPKPGSE